jgi:hypothetical protein
VHAIIFGRDRDRSSRYRDFSFAIAAVFKQGIVVRMDAVVIGIDDNGAAGDR